MSLASKIPKRSETQPNATVVTKQSYINESLITEKTSKALKAPSSYNRPRLTTHHQMAQGYQSHQIVTIKRKDPVAPTLSPGIGLQLETLRR